MPQVNLIFPEKKHEAMIQAFIEECRRHGSLFHGVSRVDELPYDAWLKNVQDSHRGLFDNPEWVPATTLLVLADDKLVGFMNIRHRLNDLLAKKWGHIGYMIRPTERRKGYAKASLAAALAYCKETLALSKVLVTCDRDNLASKKTIKANNGVYERTVFDKENASYMEHYWIDLD